MKRHYLIFAVVFFICWFQVLKGPAFVFSQDEGSADNLDQYFEDYFSEDTPEENTQEQEDGTFLPTEEKNSEEQEAPQVPSKKEEPLAESPSETVVSESEVLSNESQSADLPEETVTEMSPVAETRSLINRTETVAPKSKTVAEIPAEEPSQEATPQTVETVQQEMIAAREQKTTENISLSPVLAGESYLDSYDAQDQDFQNLLKQKEAMDRSRLMDNVVNFLIGEEVEQSTIHIQGAAAQHYPGELKTLEEAIDEATENHLPIEIAKEKVMMYRHKINKAFRDLFPGLTFSASDGKRGLGNAPDATTRTQDVKVSVRQPLYQGGELWNKVREEKANLAASMAEYHKIFSDLALEVATAYFNLAKAKTMSKYREDLLVIANKSLMLSEEKFEASLISEIEHLNVQSQQSQINHNLQQSKEDVELALLEMQKSMNLDLNQEIEVYDLDQIFEIMGAGEALEADQPSGAAGITALPDGKDSPKEAGTIQELIRMAYDNRPEFVIGENKVQSRKYAEKAQKAQWLPRATVFAEAGKNREVLDPLLSIQEGPWEDEFHLGLEFSWNLYGNVLRDVYDYNDQAPRRSGFSSGGKGDYTRTNTVALGILDGLEQFSKAKEAEVATKEAILEFELSEKDMVSEVKESYYNFNRAKIQMRSVLKKIKYRQKLVELANHRSEINEIQTSEYLQSEIDLVEERNTFYQAMVDFFVARASLNKAIGISNFLKVEALPSELLKK